MKKFEPLFIGLLLIFLLNPFIACFLSFYLLSKNDKRVNILCIFICLFIGVLGFTQNSPNGDISRSYHNMEAVIELNSNQVLIYLAATKYLIYATLNLIISKLTGNVQYTSLLWCSLIYFFCFQAIINISKYLGHERYKLFNIFMATLFCFVVFVEAMETIKQALATSMFFYGYSCFLLKRYKRCVIVYLCSLGIHFSPLFFLPFFFLSYINLPMTLSVFFISFAFRAFNLMAFMAPIVGSFGLAAISETAEGYSEQSYDNFSSNAPYFVGTFILVLGLVVMHLLLMRKEHPVITKSSLIYVAMLNLNYSNNHNFTRILLYSFPIYILIYMSFLYSHRFIRYKRLALIGILSTTFFFHYYFSAGRFGTNPNEYQTSFMNNSILDITTSSLYGYLTYKVPVK